VCELAAALRIPRVVVPRSPGTLSALGVLLGDVVKDYSRTVMKKIAGMDAAAVERSFASIEREAMRDLASEGFAKDRIKMARSVALRYVGQSFEIDVRWGKHFERAFHAAHKDRYGYSDESRPTEIVSRLKRAAEAARREAEPFDTARVYFSGRAAKAAVYGRDTLSVGARFRGPAIITEYSSTTIAPAGRTIEVDPWLNLIIA
jgi:N-methylhydantoinase A